MNKLSLVAVAMLFASGCSSFNREYKTALSQPLPTHEISGPWEGKWLSDKNGHTGKLRAVLRETGPNEYDAFFHATFWKILQASYRVPLKAEEATGRTTLSGESDLGLLSGGVYSYEGEATPTTFFCTYKSKYDHGTFELKRPTPLDPPRARHPAQ